MFHLKDEIYQHPNVESSITRAFFLTDVDKEVIIMEVEAEYRRRQYLRIYIGKDPKILEQKQVLSKLEDT